MDRRGRRGRGTRGWGTHSPSQPLHPHSPPRVDDQTHILVGEVMHMLHSFQRMFDALIGQMDKEDRGASAPTKGSQHIPHVNAHRELGKLKNLEFWGTTNGIVAKA